jgi:hypothetical protein
VVLAVQVNNTKISIFQRKRPRGDWMNVKMTGMAGESPVSFIKGTLMLPVLVLLLVAAAFCCYLNAWMDVIVLLSFGR